mgnify:CR=1 FL=1
MRSVKIESTHTGGATITIGNESHTYAGLPAARGVGVYPVGRYANDYRGVGPRLGARLLTAMTNYSRMIMDDQLHNSSYSTAGKGWSIAR